jgi:hypothetical protein
VWPRAALSWIYPEHEDIAEAAIGRLPDDARAFYRELWIAAGAPKACPEPVTVLQGPAPACVDFAAWSAIAGDHSCSPRQLLDEVLPSDWILRVASVGAVARLGLASARDEHDVLTYWAESDVGLERADPEYSSRAVTNNAHFLVARSTNDVILYARGTVAPDAELNAMGLVVAYQLGALRLATRWRATPAGERQALARAILATEAFAAHFLEDSFASGHVAGTWGDAASRKGTHDYYCTHGVDTSTWQGAHTMLFGDAHLHTADLERASRDVAAALAQVYEASREGSALAAKLARLPAPADPFTLDSCREKKMRAAAIDPQNLPLFASFLLDTPLPAPVEHLAPLPRFRSELGTFIGVYSGARSAMSANGYTSPGLKPHMFGSLEVGVRTGVGLERLVGASGLIFLEAGFVAETAQFVGCSGGDCTGAGNYRVDALLPNLPARSGLAFRLQLPFWLIPGDLLIAGPVVALFSFQSFKQMAILAGAGGLIPWQRDIRTPIGAIQFIAGRNVGVTFYGLIDGPTTAVTPTTKDAAGTQQYATLNVRTMELELPIVEYRPFHEFALRQSFTMAVQLGYAADVPTSVELATTPPGTTTTPTLSPTHMVTLKLVFDIRHYL